MDTDQIKNRSQAEFEAFRAAETAKATAAARAASPLGEAERMLDAALARRSDPELRLGSLALAASQDREIAGLRREVALHEYWETVFAWGTTTAPNPVPGVPATQEKYNDFIALMNARPHA